ncbi:winged helix-turn-helix transcriptional regulator [Streptomyces cinereospinus]|uniref:Winged helix-turn-helix transcriptional regulator n=1 Tax=Streptomyces cinereospinus TaxID=285561 RepID=A0ABV5N9B5_9ACTN
MTVGRRRAGSYVCGVDAAMDVIGGKWKVLILWELHVRPRRFGALRRELPGVTEKVLAAQLREMAADGIVHREVFEEVPPRVVYSLTERGEALNAALEPLGDWGRANVLAGHPLGPAAPVPAGSVAAAPLPAAPVPAASVAAAAAPAEPAR